ncbi:hypothetical protein BU17DRAFT_64745 [Hysterangium stoloniferum]|nr:hypothetical protein BU17DRAFT_64745 [Hysterangium stoloniferum]
MSNSPTSMGLTSITVRNVTGNSAFIEEPRLIPQSSVKALVAYDSVPDAKSLPPGGIERLREDDGDPSKMSQRTRQRSSSPGDRSGRGDRDRRRAESRNMLDSWVAPEFSHRLKKKRIKVSDITEWDTWIAPDLREEGERMERGAVPGIKEKQREKERRKRNRRTRRDAHNIDSWVADSRDGDDDRERRTRGRSDESPRRRARGDSPRRSGGDTQHPQSQAGTSKGHSQELVLIVTLLKCSGSHYFQTQWVEGFPFS